MIDLKALSFKELAEVCVPFGVPAFKVRELFRALHQRQLEAIDALTFLSKNEREKLAKKTYISRIVPEKSWQGRKVKKTAFRLEDGKIIEAVLMEYEGERNTVCVSSQVGCPVKCRFCATGKMGFVRNLTAGEIVAQVYYFSQEAEVSNIVFMGMGEPFFNYDNVLKSARLLNHSLGKKIAARKLVISTTGIVAGIRRFSEEPEQFRLAWSLTAPFDRVRQELAGIKRADPLGKVVAALRDYQQRTGRRITIEYVVLARVNDSLKDIRELIAIARSLDSHVNLIPYNPTAAAEFKGGRLDLICLQLQNARVNVSIRKSFGREINAACGQLAGGKG
jgi:23S rRNA (adenine2503-C2)-methyltransferase